MPEQPTQDHAVAHEPEHWIVMHYREDSVDTVAEAVFHSQEGAEAGIVMITNAIAARTDRKVVRDEDGDFMIYDASFDESEPSDDDHHHLLWIQSL